jgi:hypothetical protein
VCDFLAKQLWTHHAVGDEIAGPGGDVVHRHLQPEPLDAGHPEAVAGLYRGGLDRPPRGDGGIGRVEEPQRPAEPAPHPDARASGRPFHRVAEAEGFQ